MTILVETSKSKPALENMGEFPRSVHYNPEIALVQLTGILRMAIPR